MDRIVKLDEVRDKKEVDLSINELIECIVNDGYPVGIQSQDGVMLYILKRCKEHIDSTNDLDSHTTIVDKLIDVFHDVVTNRDEVFRKNNEVLSNLIDFCESEGVVVRDK